MLSAHCPSGWIHGSLTTGALAFEFVLPVCVADTVARATAPAHSSQLGAGAVTERAGGCRAFSSDLCVPRLSATRLTRLQSSVLIVGVAGTRSAGHGHWHGCRRPVGMPTCAWPTTQSVPGYPTSDRRAAGPAAGGPAPPHPPGRPLGLALRRVTVESGLARVAGARTATAR